MSVARPLHTVVDPTTLSGEDNVWSICKDGYRSVVSADCPVRLRCDHVFGEECLRLLMQDKDVANAFCPLCRIPLDDVCYNTVASLRRLAALRSDERAGRPVTRTQTSVVLHSLMPYVVQEVYAELVMERRELSQQFERARWLKDSEGIAFRAQEQLHQEIQSQAQEQRETAATLRLIVTRRYKGCHDHIEDLTHVEQQTVVTPNERLILPGLAGKALAIARNTITALIHGVAWMPSDTVATIADLKSSTRLPTLEKTVSRAV